MAGDWIPMRVDLAEDPAVIAIASATGLDEYGVVGRLHRLWSWANKQLADGYAPSVTSEWVDRYVSAPGFAAAMLAAGWLRSRSGGIEFPHFDRWNSQSAKRRVLTAQRMRKSRDAKGDAPRVTKASPEKRREEKREGKDTPQPPAQAGGSESVPAAGQSSEIGPKPSEVAVHWNSFPGLTPCVATDPHRDRIIRQWATGNPLWSQHWRAALAFMGRTPFYCGGGERTWRADLGWLLKADHFAGVVEKMLAEPTGPRLHRPDVPPAVNPKLAAVLARDAERQKQQRPAEDAA